MRFVKANPNEYLIVARRGWIVNRGQAGSAFLWPGSTHVLIPSTQQEATFEMTQESKDSIPLRFKGIVVYRVADPEAAARQFDFSNADGHAQIKTLISHVCLGELRAVVSHMTMEECIQQRTTTLTDTVASALEQVIQGRQPGQGWGGLGHRPGRGAGGAGIHRRSGVAPATGSRGAQCHPGEE
jgi:regulator of protease activity HflC (stomatin/prohibitin superfamily)